MSAESGIKTFRDSGGLWENHDIMKVASPQGWNENPRLVLDFYNARLENVSSAEPNEGHKILVELEDVAEIQIITQNIDDLHERAGSKRVLHLHGEIGKCQSSIDPNYVIPIEGKGISWGDKCPLGSQLRPHIVWFGEEVSNMERAVDIISEADMVLIIGSSLEVYPAAGLVQYAASGVDVVLIDPNDEHRSAIQYTHIVEGAREGLMQFKMMLKQKGWF